MINHDKLLELLHYDPETGIFTWTDLAAPKVRGKKAGSKHSGGYWEICLDRRKRTFCHRLAWFYMTGAMPAHQIDHINGDRADNRWINLREATQQNNSGNMRRRSRNKSGFKGVVKQKNRFLAYIHVSGKTEYLGSFKSAENAHAAYLIAAKRAFGEYARAA